MSGTDTTPSVQDFGCLLHATLHVVVPFVAGGLVCTLLLPAVMLIALIYRNPLLWYYPLVSSPLTNNSYTVTISSLHNHL
ncbi:hypothetical protein BDZ97DRAFT_1077700 [Flammula alnicola]|nr:hypothetical protein BDZ97DRAFT_1077700 [Flammula alnicola]